ncbi:MAG: formyltransferase family protein [Putridiphycobacter sp.]
MISLFLMTHKGFKVLEYLIETQNIGNILNVISSEDPNVQEDYFDNIKSLCADNKITFFNRDEEYVLGQVSIAISWRWLINESQTKLVVIHDSILPKYRGFSPLVSALINGEKQIGATAIYASKEFDKGNIVDQKTLDIKYPIKIQEAIDRISNLYCDIVETLLSKDLISIEGKPQIEKEASYSLWRDEDDYVIDWTQNSEHIKRFIDSVGFPYKGAKTIMDNKIIRIFDVTVINDVTVENRTAGKVLFNSDGLPIVVCGTGLIRINDAKYENGDDVLPLKKFRTKFTNPD